MPKEQECLFPVTQKSKTRHLLKKGNIKEKASSVLCIAVSCCRELHSLCPWWKPFQEVGRPLAALTGRRLQALTQAACLMWFFCFAFL